MGTEIKAVQGRRAAGGQLGGDGGVDHFHLRFGHQAAGDDGLVGDNNKAEAGLGEPAQGLRHTGQNADLAGVGQPINVFNEDAVAVEKGGAGLVWRG